MDNNNYPYQKSLDEYYYMTNTHMPSAGTENANYMLPHNGKTHNMENPHLPIPLHQPLPNPHLHQPYANLPLPAPPADHHHPPNYSMHQSIPPSMYHQLPPPPVLGMHHHQMPAYPINYQIDHTAATNSVPPTDLSNVGHRSNTSPSETEPTNYSMAMQSQEPVPPVSQEHQRQEENQKQEELQRQEERQRQEEHHRQEEHRRQEEQKKQEEHNRLLEQSQQAQQQPVSQIQQVEEPEMDLPSNENHETYHPQESLEQPSQPMQSIEEPYKPRLSAIARYNPTSPMCPKKKRRRIVQMNDDDSDDNTNDLKRELLNKSPEPQAETSQVPSDNIESAPIEESKPEEQDPTEDSSEDSSDSTENDTTIEDPAAALLKNAVIIQATDKKKKRVLDSDDEDQHLTNVDDIGLHTEDGIEEDDESFADNILVSETDPNLEPIAASEIETVVPIENPIIPQEEDIPEQPEVNEENQSETPPENQTENEDKPEKSETASKDDNDDDDVVCMGEVTKSVKSENADDEIDPAGIVEATLDKNKSSSEDDDEFIPNDVYFGTPDMAIANPVKRPAPRRSRNSSGQSQSSKRKRKNEYEKETSSESSGSDSSYSESSSEDTSEEDRKKKVVYRRPVPVVKPKFTIANLQTIKKFTPAKRKVVKDRFYDRSRDIPNDIYFGDVKVPLHVLHTRWDSDASDSSSSSSEPDHFSYNKFNPNMRNFSPNMRNFNPMMRKPQNIRTIRPVGKVLTKPRNPTFRPGPSPSTSQSIDLTEDPKLTTYKNFIKLAGIKVNYPRLFEGISAVDDKCLLIRRVLAQKGLQGEPTIAKCKQLKLDLQTKREIADLDTSAIISGRTRRSSGRINKPKTAPSDSLQPETLQTLSKIKRVIDSDSE